jgi:ribosomal-protein-serine acetyltransferase
MILQVNPNIRLELLMENHAPAIFEMVDHNRLFLRPWLPFVDRMVSVGFAHEFVKGSRERNLMGLEYGFIIYENDTPVGRIGVYKIVSQNHIGEIGYWLIENKQGKGIITLACQTLIDFCFDTLNLNRIELKCGTGNHKSMGIPQRLSFTKEGVIREGEWLYDTYIDLYLFALLKKDRQTTPLS